MGGGGRLVIFDTIIIPVQESSDFKNSGNPKRPFSIRRAQENQRITIRFQIPIIPLVPFKSIKASRYIWLIFFTYSLTFFTKIAILVGFITFKNRTFSLYMSVNNKGEHRLYYLWKWIYYYGRGEKIWRKGGKLHGIRENYFSSQPENHMLLRF